MPYVIGRYSAYSDSPDQGTINRLFGAVGARVTTAFWKVDDTVQSQLLDLHRLRHVIEPELNVFTSGTTVDRSDVYVFDEQVDSINDLSAVQFGIRQRWQTYRGGPGRWRSVDFLTLNVEAVLFANQPGDDIINPVGFRGLYFPTLPETSVPRNAINADMTWRIADTTAVLSDVSWNADKRKLATASVGVVAQRDERLSYYVGTRYIDEINSNITTVAADYQVSSKYNLSFAQSFDFGLGENVVSSVAVVRKFDTFFLVFKAFSQRNDRPKRLRLQHQPPMAGRRVGRYGCGEFRSGIAAPLTRRESGVGGSEVRSESLAAEFGVGVEPQRGGQRHSPG